MPHTWKRALDEYRYPVDLRKFAGAPEHDGWFELNICPGDPLQTMGFEARFRKQACHHRETWAEVAFWKLFTIPPAKNKGAQNVLDSSVCPADLYSSCMEYIEKPSLASFGAFKQILGVHGPGIALAATFPAFLCPDRFPMVDTQVTKWALQNHSKHNYSAIGGPDLLCLPDLDGVLGESHWPFVESWMAWCRFTASKLSQRAGCVWRSRDVEMAVFTAQRCQN